MRFETAHLSDVDARAAEHLGRRRDGVDDLLGRAVVAEVEQRLAGVVVIIERAEATAATATPPEPNPAATATATALSPPVTPTGSLAATLALPGALALALAATLALPGALARPFEDARPFHLPTQQRLASPVGQPDGIERRRDGLLAGQALADGGRRRLDHQLQARVREHGVGVGQALVGPAKALEAKPRWPLGHGLGPAAIPLSNPGFERLEWGSTALCDPQPGVDIAGELARPLLAFACAFALELLERFGLGVGRLGLALALATGECELAALGGFDLDPAAGAELEPIAETRWTVEDDGLSREWFGDVWLNPPYGRQLNPAWAEKAHREALRDDVETLTALVPASTDTQWFQNHYATADLLCFVEGRIAFDGAGDSKASFPSVLAVWGELPPGYVDVLRSHGFVLGAYPHAGGGDCG